MSHPARSTLEPPDYDGHFAMIPLTKGKFAIVDEADAELVLSQGQWTAVRDPESRNWYAKRSANCKTLSMHSLLTGYKLTDHANRNSLDNRRINLREATWTQNMANRGPFRNNKSGYKGVSWDKRYSKWRAAIRPAGVQRHLGYFVTREDAARAYDAAALEIYGEFAYMNFPDGYPARETSTC